LSAYEVTSSGHPRIVLDIQGIPHVVWTHHKYALPEIYYTTINDSGWTSPICLSNPYNATRSDIAIDSQNHVHVFFSPGSDIYHKQYDGSNWLPIEMAMNLPLACNTPRIAIDSQDRIHLVWQDYGNFGPPGDLGYSVYEGGEWREPVGLSIPNGLAAWEPDIAIDSDDNPHIAWTKYVALGVAEVFYAFHDGINWSPPTNISNLDSLEVSDVALEISSNGVKYIMYKMLGVSQVVLTYYQNGSWSSLDPVIENVFTGKPDLAIGAGNIVHTVIVPTVDPGNSEIFYQYTTAGTTSLQTTLTPQFPPIVIPAGGGNFAFDVQVANVQVLPLYFDLWTDCVLPNGHVSRYFLYRTGINIGVGSSIQRFNLQQNIPGSAPAGSYFYRLLTGEYPSVVVAADSFAFEKEGSGVGDWGLERWSLSETISGNLNMEVGQTFLSAMCSPNPFNPSTTIRFGLPETQQVRLAVFDVQGRQVAVLVDGWREAGYHEALFDGSDLASGVYYYRLQAGEFTTSEKMVLVK
ncbi:MAG: T9SS type A sorting domain-containing protein, partial [bacterium]